jgi:RNA polymerase sigma-70 factor (ECF subfamily)
MAQEQAITELSTEEAIYRRYAPEVFAYLLHHIPVYHDAEDLLTEIFLAVLEKLPSLNTGEHRLGAYLQKVASNKVVDYYRLRSKQRLVSLDDVAPTTFAGDELSPEQIAIASERSVNLHWSISKLPETQQIILRLRFVHGLRYGEIAKLIARNESAVRMMLNRSLKLLRNLNPIYEER